MVHIFAYILPEVCLAIYSFLAIFLSSIYKRDHISPKLIYISMPFVTLSLIFVLIQYTDLIKYSWDIGSPSNFIEIVFKPVILAILSITVLTLHNISKHKILSFFPEASALCFISAMSSMLIISAENIVFFYLAFELLNIATYTLIASSRDAYKSTEAGIKYFFTSTLASSLMLYSLVMLYISSGEIDIVEIIKHISESGSTGDIIFSILFISSLMFKLSLAPLHVILPDIYEGSPVQLLPIISFLPKVAVIGFLTKISIITSSEHLILTLTILSSLSMIIGTISALRQENLLRFVAYSSVAHLGYIASALLVHSHENITYIYIYLYFYVITTAAILAFLGQTIYDNKKERFVFCFKTYRDISGLAQAYPFKSIALAILLLSSAGIPPLAGFVSKFLILKLLLFNSYNALALLMIISSMISTFYYFTIIKTIFVGAVQNAILENKRYNRYKVTTIDAVLLIAITMNILLIFFVPLL